MEQAHLAIPDSRQKVSVLLQIFQNYPDVLEQAILHKQVYVGVHSSGQDRNFSTVLGEWTTLTRFTAAYFLRVSTALGKEGVRTVTGECPKVSTVTGEYRTCLLTVHCVRVQHLSLYTVCRYAAIHLP